MKFISLFAGIGGFDLGLERAGMQCIGQVEIDPFCQKILKKHWPHVKLIGDIHNVKQNTFEACELICGGFPCQPFTTAGRRKGKEDPRHLWPEMLRIINEYKPTWVFGENVAGIINMELDNIISSLESEGYETRAIVLPACAVDAPHKRDRVWILSYSDKNRYIKNDKNNKQKEQNEIIWKQLFKTYYRNDRTAKWADKPDIHRMVNGVSGEMDRLAALGNAVVPQIVEIIGRYILYIHNSRNNFF